ncbi:MAG: hypothetical protein KAT70_06755, partial [Thermoplasmata archaeon]|nr:hypothetical protein [Thermoplasmata archaeon]
LTGVSMLKYLTNDRKIGLNNQKELLEHKCEFWSDLEPFIDHGLVESIRGYENTSINSIKIQRVIEKIDVIDYDLVNASKNLFNLTSVGYRSQESLMETIIQLKQHITLIMEAEKRDAALITDNPATAKFLFCILKSINEANDQTADIFRSKESMSFKSSPFSQKTYFFTSPLLHSVMNKSNNEKNK